MTAVHHLQKPPPPDAVASPRSRLTPEREAALYAESLAILSEVGYEALTMDAVAHRAHVSKATIYRLWGGKVGLVVAALRHTKGTDEPLPDTGSLSGDLRVVARSMGAVAVDGYRLVTAVSHAMQADPELGAAVRDCIVTPGAAKLRQLLDRAVERGEVDADRPGLSRIPELILSVFLARPFLEGLPADESHLTALIDAVVLPALGTPRPAARGDRRPPSASAARRRSH